MAAVGEGDLPQGAMSFQKLLKYQVLLWLPNVAYGHLSAIAMRCKDASITYISTLFFASNYSFHRVNGTSWLVR